MRDAHAQWVNHVWVLASCKLAALIFTCIYLMVSAMTSYSSLTSRRIFVSRQHSTESDFEFHQCPKYSRRAVFSSFAKQCLLSVNLKLLLMQTEQQTQERQIVNTRRGRFYTEKSSGVRTLESLIQRHKQQRWRQRQQTVKQKEHHSMNVEC